MGQGGRGEGNRRTVRKAGAQQTVQGLWTMVKTVQALGVGREPRQIVKYSCCCSKVEAGTTVRR